MNLTGGPTRRLPAPGVVVALSAAAVIAGFLLGRMAFFGSPGQQGTTEMGITTSFGYIAVDGADLTPRPVSQAVRDQDAPAAEAVLGVSLEVENGSAEEILFAPGRIRLEVGSDPFAARLDGASTIAAAIAPGDAETVTVAFMVPADQSLFTLSYLEDDGSAAGPLTFAARADGV